MTDVRRHVQHRGVSLQRCRHRPACVWYAVPTSPVVPTLSQPPEGVGDTKSRSKTTVSPTSPCGPNLLLHIHVGERKRSGTCFSIRKEKDPRWGHRGWDHIRSSHWSETIKGCPNPLEGWDHARRRLGPGRAARRSSPAASSLVVFALAEDRRMLNPEVTKAEGPQLVSLYDEHTDPRAGRPPRAGRDLPVLHPRPRSRHHDRLGAPKP